jgi:hypothetical protein
MTQQTLILEPPTLRYAVKAPDSPSIRPGTSEGLLRPKTRADYMRSYRARRGARASVGGSAHWSQEAREKRAQTLQSKPAVEKFRPSRYVGLMNSAGRRDKYRDAERVGVTRLLMDHELEEWHARISEILTKRATPRGTLDEKPR